MNDWKDYRIIQRQRAQELQRQGYVLIAEGITREEFTLKCRSKELPVKAIHLWAIDEAYAPGPKQESVS